MLSGVFTAAPFSAMLPMGHPMKNTPKKNAAAQSLTAMRNKKLTPARRRQIAQTAAAARWAHQSATETTSPRRPQ